MAGLASLREAALVRIVMAIGAFAEWQSGETRLVVRPRRVTLGAGDLRVHSGQRITRLRVIKLADVLPLCRVVTLLAIRPQSSVVLVLVTANAVRRNAQETPVEIANLDERTHCRGDVLRRMTAVAGDSCVLAFQRVPGLPVIEGLWVQLDQGEVFSIMFGVAADALLARSRGEMISSVQAFAFGQSLGDLRMAIQALECGLP